MLTTCLRTLVDEGLLENGETRREVEPIGNLPNRLLRNGMISVANE
jgi:hypothetical protein